VTEDDLDRIEQALSLCLPPAYRRTVVPFLIPSEAGNVDSPLWDDAGRLIVLNLRLRAEDEGWPPWLFAIGQSEGDPCGYAIDTRAEDCPVWWLDHLHLGPASGPSEGPFADWLARRLADPGPDERGDGSELWFLLAWLVASFLAVVASWLWRIRRS
jgi:hypothetical protein